MTNDFNCRRVLLLDFDGKFTLLIPNIELGKAFRINKADVEVRAFFFTNNLKTNAMRFRCRRKSLKEGTN